MKHEQNSVKFGIVAGKSVPSSEHATSRYGNLSAETPRKWECGHTAAVDVPSVATNEGLKRTVSSDDLVQSRGHAPAPVEESSLTAEKYYRGSAVIAEFSFL